MSDTWPAIRAAFIVHESARRQREFDDRQADYEELCELLGDEVLPDFVESRRPEPPKPVKVRRPVCPFCDTPMTPCRGDIADMCAPGPHYQMAWFCQCTFESAPFVPEVR